MIRGQTEQIFQENMAPTDVLPVGGEVVSRG